MQIGNDMPPNYSTWISQVHAQNMLVQQGLYIPLHKNAIFIFLQLQRSYMQQALVTLARIIGNYFA